MIAATAAAAAGFGGLNDGRIATGAAVVASCDPNSVTVLYTITSGLVTQVTIADIDAACTGGELSVTLVDAATANIGTGGPLTVTSSSATVAVTPQPARTSVAATHVVIAGP
jgi:hypothetical protein